MSAPAVVGQRSRLAAWSVTRKPVRKWFGGGEVPVWFLATDPDGVHHDVGVRNNHAFCLHHGTQCQAPAAVLARLLARELTLLPSRAEIEEKVAPHVARYIDVGYHLTDIGKEAMNEAPTLWCPWCDLALDPFDATIVNGEYVHLSCAPEAVSDREDLKE